MKEKIKVWKVTYDGTYCILYTAKDAIETVKCEMEEELFTKIEIEALEMTEDELAALPEFEGF